LRKPVKPKHSRLAMQNTWTINGSERHELNFVKE